MRRWIKFSSCGALTLATLLAITWPALAIPDFSLVCRRGYRLTAIRRSNSAHQRDSAGSLSIECERILPTNVKPIQCNTLENTPQCNGYPEGCTGSQWLAGFHAYAIENSTNSVLLDPVCCSSPSVHVDQTSCATERLNQAKQPFNHRLLASDVVYRGMQCWHQYNSVNTIVDLVWKMEICQFGLSRSNDEARVFAVTRHSITDEIGGGRLSGEMLAASSASTLLSAGGSNTFGSEFSPNCAPCTCHCGIDLCGNGAEPIRIVHKAIHPHKCSCDCACKYECV